MKKILLDTHILIRRESDQTIGRHLQDVMRYATKLGYQPVVHRSSVNEIKNDKNIPDSKKTFLLSKIGTYPEIVAQANPYDDGDFLDKIDKPESQRETEDMYLLYCLYKNEVDLFLTEDSEIMAKATSLGISGKVKNLLQATRSFSKALSEGSDDIPVFSFYKAGTMWHIGYEGKNVSAFEDMVGFERIYLLLQHENDSLPSDVLLSGGKIDPDYCYGISRQDLEILGLHVDAGVRYDPRISKNRKNIGMIITKLKEELCEEMSLDEKLEKEDLLSSAKVIPHSESHGYSPLFPEGAVSYCRVSGPSFFL